MPTMHGDILDVITAIGNVIEDASVFQNYKQELKPLICAVGSGRNMKDCWHDLAYVLQNVITMPANATSQSWQIKVVGIYNGMLDYRDFLVD